jgi:predicted nucleic acid-binding protein
MILVDTNILVRLADEADPDYKTTHQAIAACWRRGRKLLVADQALQEFWVVATRPVTNNGLGMSPDQTDQFLNHFARAFIRIADPPGLFDAWRSPVNAHAIRSIRSYDARFIAFVQMAKLNGFMTYNLEHFSNFSVRLVNPKDPATW